MQHRTLIIVEVILWPFVFVAKLIWTAFRWILFAIGEIIGYLDC